MSEAATKPDIVVGVDGSDESFAALKWALEEASLTGQSVNAVFGWTHSWDMGSEPDSDEAWAKVRHDIANELRVWVDKAAAGIDFDPANLKLTSVKASGTSALLQIGHDSQQIVVGRRSLSRMARWFMGSLSASLAEAEEGERWGFYNRLVAPEELHASADALARELAAGPTFAHGMTKKCLEQEWSMGIAEAIEAEAQAQAICMQTRDYGRAYRAFVDKRKPEFQGD